MRLLSFTLLSSLCVLPVICSATDATKSLDDLSLEQLLDISTTTSARMTQKSSDTPSNIYVIDREEITTFGWRSLADALNSLPGVYFSSDRLYSYMGTRGISPPGDLNMRVLLLINGVRSNDSLYDQAYLDSSFPLPMSLIERIEYAPGSGSAAYGSNAFLGVINVITRNAEDIKGTEVGTAIGSNGFNQQTLIHGEQNNDQRWVLAGSTSQSVGENIRLGSDNTNNINRQDTLYNANSMQNQQLFAQWQKGSLSTQFIHGNRNKDLGVGNFGYDFVAGQKAQDTLSLAHINLNKALDNGLKLETGLMLGQVNYRGNYFDGGIPAQETGKGNWWAVDMRLSGEFAAHRWLVGSDIRQDSQLSLVCDNEQTTHYNQRKAFFIQDEWSLNAYWTMNLGLRTDHTDYTNATHPRLSLNYKPDHNHVYKLLVGSAFREANAYERYFVSTYNAANLNLKPETIQTIELVAEQQRRHLTLKGSIFAYHINNLIEQVALDDGSGKQQYQNMRNADAHGIELAAQHHFSNDIKLGASYTWQQARDADNQQWAINSPQHIVKIKLSTPLGDTWRLGAETWAMSERLTLDEAGNRQAVAGMSLANINLSSNKLAKHLTVSVGIYNLFDHRYNDPASSDNGSFSLPQAMQSWRANLSYRF